MLLSPSYKTIELLPIVESLFDLGQKGFRQWAKRLSTMGKKAFDNGQKGFRPWSIIKKNIR